MSDTVRPAAMSTPLSEGAPTDPGVATAAHARAHARAVVREQWDTRSRTARDEDVIDLLLVVSELVTNAIRHGDGLAGFEVAVTDDGVRLLVHDHSDAVPRSAAGAAPPGHRVSGYGWPLVLRLAREVAVDRRAGGGKTISALMPLTAASDGPARG
ncbi:ATP-binding protein [Streptomyces sp. NPDC091279]|uniref:ATP-binding protein n=1 Tax=unclassified Streptomyces TaxID=2593676 RepID=UPI003800DFED